MTGARRRRILDLDLIVATALEIVDETGDFSMPMIAKRLGVSAPALYHHVESRAELVDLIRIHLFDTLFDDFRKLPWQEAVRSWSDAYRGIFSAHPNLVDILVRYPIRDRSSLTAFDQLTEILIGAGVPDDQTIVWVTLFDSLTLSVALYSVAPDELWDTSKNPMPMLDQALAVGPRQPEIADAAFDIGIDALIERLRRTVGRSR